MYMYMYIYKYIYIYICVYIYICIHIYVTLLHSQVDALFTVLPLSWTWVSGIQLRNVCVGPVP